MPNRIFIKGPVPAHVEADLRRLCAIERAANGSDYGDTFAEVVQSGIRSLEHKRCEQTAQNIQALRGFLQNERPGR